MATVGSEEVVGTAEGAIVGVMCLMCFFLVCAAL